MRIFVTGASGFVGKPLVAYLAKKNHDVVPLHHEMSASGDLSWPFDQGFFEDIDAVIHLAGEPLSFSRWSSSKKSKILRSRAQGTAALSFDLSRILHPPKIFISASAVGYYGNRGEELLDETSARGKGFLPHVCKLWEEASHAIDARGSRVVHARFGMVLGKNGGALKKMAPLYRFGLGGKVGKGEQWISWIALPDLIKALDFILHTDSIEGAINCVSPEPVRQKEFSKTLAKTFHVPAILPAPAWAFRLAFGTMADELLLASTRAVPQKLCSHGFEFLYPNLKDALDRAFAEQLTSFQ